MVLHFPIQLDDVFDYMAEFLFGAFLLLFAGSPIGVLFLFLFIFLDDCFGEFVVFGFLHPHQVELLEVFIQNRHNGLFVGLLFLYVLYLLVGLVQFLLL